MLLARTRRRPEDLCLELNDLSLGVDHLLRASKSLMNIRGSYVVLPEEGSAGLPLHYLRPEAPRDQRLPEAPTT